MSKKNFALHTLCTGKFHKYRKTQGQWSAKPKKKPPCKLKRLVMAMDHLGHDPYRFINLLDKVGHFVNKSYSFILSYGTLHVA